MMGHQPPTESGFDAITSTYDDIMRVNERIRLSDILEKNRLSKNKIDKSKVVVMTRFQALLEKASLFLSRLGKSEFIKENNVI